MPLPYSSGAADSTDVTDFPFAYLSCFILSVPWFANNYHGTNGILERVAPCVRLITLVLVTYLVLWVH